MSFSNDKIGFILNQQPSINYSYYSQPTKIIYFPIN